jgi:hypothetical protein
MRTIGFRSNILFAIAAAIGVIAALGQPWYAKAPPAPEAPANGELPAQMEDFLAGIGRAFTNAGGRSGWDTLTTADSLLAGLAVATVVLLLLTFIPAVQAHVQALARWTGLATLAVVVVKLFDEPGANGLTEPRYGVFVAALAAAVAFMSGSAVAAAPLRSR